MRYFVCFLSVFLTALSAFGLNCHGTEPFWNAEVHSDRLVYESVVGPTVIYPVTQVSGATGYVSDFIQIYSNESGPVAVVTSNQCDDSMSDYIFPKEIIFFTGSETLYGCCGMGTPL